MSGRSMGQALEGAKQTCFCGVQCRARKSWRPLSRTGYYPILYYTILYYTILYYTILYYTILYSTLLYSTLLYSTLLYSTLYTLYSIPKNVERDIRRVFQSCSLERLETGTAPVSRKSTVNECPVAVYQCLFEVYLKYMRL